MKTNFARKIVIIIGFVISIVLATSVSYAASSLSIAAGSTSLTVGSSTTLTIRANNVTGRINITSSNPDVISLSSSSEWVENGSVTIRATAKAAGSAYITVTSEDTSDSTTGDPVSISTGVNLTSKEVVVDTRSSNNYLSSLNIEGYELSPAFNTNTNNYTMNVTCDVASINISAIPADTKAKTVVDGNLDLVAGENNVTVTVTAENGYKRVYTITVVKEKNPDDIDATIESLVINNAVLKNEFKPDIFEYMCDDITADINKLDIVIQTKIPDLKYEIVGNDDLKQGINHIVIKVTSRDGSVTKEYEIIVFKTDEVLALEETEPVIADAQQNDLLIKIKEYKYEIMLGVGAIVVIIIVIILVIVLRKNKKEESNEQYMEEYSDGRTIDEKESEENIINNEIDEMEYDDLETMVEKEEEITEVDKETEVEEDLEDNIENEISEELELKVNIPEKMEEVEISKNEDLKGETEHKVRKGNLVINSNKDKSEKDDEKKENKTDETKIKLDLSKLSDKK